MPSEEHDAIIFRYAQTAFVVGVINHVTAAGLYSPPSLMMSVNARRSRPPRLQILYVILHKTQIELLENKRCGHSRAALQDESMSFTLQTADVCSWRIMLVHQIMFPSCSKPV